MENNREKSYICMDNNICINEKSIVWIHQVEKCMYLCTKPNGCEFRIGDTHMICESKNPDGFNKLLGLINK